MNENIKLVGGINLNGIRKICKLIEDGKQVEAVELLNDLQNIQKLLDENKRKFEIIQKENMLNIEKV